MTEMSTTPTCVFHPDRETLLSCTRCGQPVCPDCVVRAAVGMHCLDCLGEGRPVAAVPAPTPKASRLGRTLRSADRPQRAERARGRDNRSTFRPGLMFYGLLTVFLTFCVVAALTEFSGGVTGYHRFLGFSIVLTGAILSVTLHEYAHALTAYRGGDISVVDKGYLTLDPRNYAHPVLSIGFPLLALVLGGLPLPGGAVWLETERLRSRWWRTGVALAGPAANLVFGAVIAIVLATGVFDGMPVLSGSLAFLVWIEFALVILNLIPIPGLDGYHAIEPHLPYEARRVLAPLEMWGMFILLFLVFSTNALDFIWNWGLDMTTGLGVPIEDVARGQELGNPRIFADDGF